MTHSFPTRRSSYLSAASPERTIAVDRARGTERSAEQAALAGDGSGSGAGRHPQLGEDVLQVASHGVRAQVKGLSDLAVRKAPGGVTEDLALSLGTQRIRTPPRELPERPRFR